MSLQLVLNGAKDGGRTMTNIQTAYAAGEIEKAVPVNILYHRALRLSDVERRRVAQPARNRVFPACHQGARFRPGKICANLNRFQLAPTLCRPHRRTSSQAPKLNTTRSVPRRDSHRPVWSRDILRVPRARVRGRNPTA